MTAKIKHYTINDKDYEIRYNITRMEMYENTHRPVMATFVQNGGSFSIGELCGLIAVGLKPVGGNFVNPKQGLEYARQLLEENGYIAMFEEVSTALERDCGFFFMGAETD